MAEIIYNPAQSSSVPLKLKLKNHLWRMVNSTIFRFTPPR